MTATFTITAAEDGGFQFHLMDDNGSALLIGAESDSRDDAEKTIQDVRVGSLMSQQIAKGQTPDSQYFFLIKDSLGNVIAKSDLFADEMEFNNALNRVKETACIAEVAPA